ncbi:MAG: VCBS repeat-containing protein [Oscillospiraceae bacterium]|nr:VCBS repeat-containing protein [Oscillospiraceae bacterium]
MKRKLWILLAAALPLLLTGCMMSASVDELYALPQLPEEYKSLSARLSEILALGAEYAAPQAGSNLPPVQMTDLDGDGIDEALGFFRISSEERPLKIYVFRASGDDYQQAAVIDGSGTSIHSVRYEDMDGDGVREILVSWQVSAEVRTVSVYSMKGLEPVPLMSTPYARYEVVDLDGDDEQELVVLRSDDTDVGQSLADYYDWDSAYSGLQLQSTARLSAPVAALQRMQIGQLQEGETAVFVTSRVAGEEDASNAVTDILLYRSPELVNIVLKEDTGVSAQIARYLSILPGDITGNGALEVPRPAQLLSEPGEDVYWKIYWHSYRADGASRQEAVTYHNQTDGWYFLLPEGWDGHFTVRQNNTSASVHATTFYDVSGRTIGEELLTIYTLTGTDRENQAAKSGRAILRRRGETIYAISYSQHYEDWRYAVDSDAISECFKVITKQLSMGEN